jgi:hypothetical protein
MEPLITMLINCIFERSTDLTKLEILGRLSVVYPPRDYSSFGKLCLLLDIIESWSAPGKATNNLLNFFVEFSLDFIGEAFQCCFANFLCEEKEWKPSLYKKIIRIVVGKKILRKFFGNLGEIS